MKNRIEAAIRETIALHEGLIEQAALVEQIGRRLAEALRAGGTLYVLGNGGSAADAQHMAGEMVGRFLLEGRPPLPCVALTTDTSVLTAVGNDFGMDEVFVRQVQALVGEGDAVLGISTSGNSANVNRALEEARRRGALTVGLIGRDGGAMAGLCELALVVPGKSSPRIQEAHATVIHLLCDLIERLLAERESPGAGQRE
jgi:D-sedoheptulose 7-phosphate isomerase